MGSLQLLFPDGTGAEFRTCQQLLMDMLRELVSQSQAVSSVICETLEAFKQRKPLQFDRWQQLKSLLTQVQS